MLNDQSRAHAKQRSNRSRISRSLRRRLSCSDRKEIKEELRRITIERVASGGALVRRSQVHARGEKEKEKETTVRDRERKDGRRTEREGERSRSGSTRLAPP